MFVGALAPRFRRRTRLTDSTWTADIPGTGDHVAQLLAEVRQNLMANPDVVLGVGPQWG